MPSVTDGLSLEDSGTIAEDPFTASLVAKLAEPEGEEAAEAPSPPRDPETGRFVSRGTPEGEEGTPEGVEDVSALQARLEEKDSFIGRQANEIGELRARLEALEARKEEPAPQQDSPEITFIPEDVAEGLVERVGPTQAVIKAMQEGLDPDSQPFQAIFNAAAEAVESQGELADLVELRLVYRQEIENPQDEVTEDPALEYARQSMQSNVVAQAVQEVRNTIPDFDALAPYFEKAAQRAPEYFEQELASGDGQRVGQALILLADSSRGLMSQAAAAGEAVQAQTSEAARAAKQAAQVATGGAAPLAASGTPSEPEADEALRLFKEQFRAAISPSVQDGLTLE